MADDDADFIRYARLLIEMSDRLPRITPAMRDAFDAMTRATDPDQRRELLEWLRQQRGWAYPGPPIKPSPAPPPPVAKDPPPQEVAKDPSPQEVAKDPSPQEVAKDPASGLVDTHTRKKREPREIAKAALRAIYQPDGCPPKKTPTAALHVAVRQHIRDTHPGTPDEKLEFPSPSTVERAQADLAEGATARVLAEKQAHSKKTP